VDVEYDQGQIIAQWPVPVLAADTPETLARRVLHVEHLLYPAAIEALASRMTRGQGVERFATVPSASFQFASAETPSVADVRRALGLED
jgi:hypothetical protein